MIVEDVPPETDEPNQDMPEVPENEPAAPSTRPSSFASSETDSFLLKSVSVKNELSVPCGKVIYRPFQEFNSQMKEMLDGLNTIKDLLMAMVEVKEGGGRDIERLKKLLNQTGNQNLTLRQTSQTASGQPEDHPKMSPYEERVISFLPINKYTQAMNWMLKQQPIRDIIYIQVLKKAYEDYTQFKPDNEYIVKKYLNILLSDRLMGHFGKATGGGRNLDFSRCPMPMPILTIADEKLARLHKVRPPGAKDNAELMKQRCNDVRTARLLRSDYISGASCQEEMAIRIFLERIDFYENHQVTCPLVQM